MIRPENHLYPPIEPVVPRQAVTLILLRDAADGEGFEVLLSRRSPQARFVPNVFVFPGGGLEDSDAAAALLAQRRPGQDETQARLAAAAIRECVEELGILLARDRHGAPIDRCALATAGLARHLPLAPQLTRLGWQLAIDTLFPFAHWTTDRDYPLRFEVPFLIARAPAAQDAVADEVEQFDATWIRPQQALARHDSGNFPLVYPTIRSLQLLARFDSAEAVLTACRNGPLMPPSCPRAGFVHGQEQRFMEHEPPFGELHLVCPNGELHHELAWQHERAVPLLRHIQRLTAPNAGPMTGPGTNTYLVGEPATGYLVIDPGPADPDHLQRILHHTGGAIHHIVCTHSHPDHSPGAAPLQALVGQTGTPRPPIHGMASGPHARADSRFTPDNALVTGDELQLCGQRPATGTANTNASETVTHTLKTVHTPGHVTNHLCFVLVEDGLLFSGDHILGGSTTVVIPPDGNMQDFLDSLERLDVLCQRYGIEFILPAHGHVLGHARDVIARLKAHRLQREAKVLRAIEQHPLGSVEDWIASAYADTPQALWPVARYSLLAHVQRLALLHPHLNLQRVPMPSSPAAPH